MFLPLYDKNPLKIVPFQFVTCALIVVNVLVFCWQSLLNTHDGNSFVLAYGLVPVVLFNEAVLPLEVVRIPAEFTLVSSAFLHADIWHLLGNMLFLWVFGDNIEDALGHRKFFIFYMACAVLSGLTHSFFASADSVPLIGASGAVAGVMGAYLLLHPKVKILILAFSRIPLYLRAHLLLLAWLLLQVLSVFTGDKQVAWWAHIGGFAFGMLLVIPLRHRDVPLLDKGVEH